MGSPFLYYTDDRLSSAELSAARLDGHVVEVGDAYIPADAVETAALRAESLRDVLGTTLAASHLTAAWIHGAGHEAPVRHTVQRAVQRRIHAVLDARVRYRDSRVEVDDLVLIGGMWVTSVPRTLADLARVDDDDHRHALALLIALTPTEVPHALEWLRTHRGVPGKRVAIAALRTAGQEDWTR
ncbi:hypothetical protein ACFQZV_09665 [Microbacterium koreense]|uniref:AbiEi antitoxin C-terminal domain-containing protein n=1 Tax=Microbacterium koreense TaxID=323761 RepID=A0ABW2ZSJ9_9MICO